MIAPVASSIRTTTLLFAAAHGWPVVNHNRFADWAAPNDGNNTRWLLLDPLCSQARFGTGAVRARLTRVATPQGLRVDGDLPKDASAVVHVSDVVVLDDVVASGTTLCEAVHLVEHAGGRVARFIVCAARPAGRSAALSAAPDAEWFSYTTGGFETVHLRDACPFVPFASRPVWNRRSIPTDNGSVGVSMPVTAFRGGLWGQLAIDSRLGHTIMAGKREIAQRFSTALGRPAIVADVPLLGTNVMLPLKPSQTADANSKLEELMR